MSEQLTRVEIEMKVGSLTMTYAAESHQPDIAVKAAIKAMEESEGGESE